MIRLLASSLLLIAGAAPATAGLLDPITSCTLSLSISGKLTVGSDGRTMSSETNNGSAKMLLVGVNLQPQLVFAAPVVTGPTGWGGSATTTLSVETASGVRTGYQTGPITVNPGAVIDTITVNTKILSPDGFKAGSYGVDSTITCQAA